MGGLMTALCVIIMCFGTMIPFMTYASPVFCLIIGGVLLKIMRKTGFISWYFATAVLSALLSPDKEAAAVFIALGLYPLFRVWFEKFKIKWILKMLYFNTTILLLYWLLLQLIGMKELVNEFSDIGAVLTVIMLFTGNVIFLIIDKILSRLERANKFKFRKV